MKLTKNQQKLLTELAHVFYALEDECEESDEFNDIMADNDDLFPMSIGELAGEWLSLACGERGTEVEQSENVEEELVEGMPLSRVLAMFNRNSINGEISVLSDDQQGSFLGSKPYADGSGEINFVGVYNHRTEDNKVMVYVNNFDIDAYEDEDEETGFMAISPEEYGFYEIAVKEVLDTAREIVAQVRPDLRWSELEVVFAE